MRLALAPVAFLLGIAVCDAALAGTFVYSHERSTLNGSRVFGLRVDGRDVTEVGDPPFTTSGAVSADLRGNLGTIAYSSRRKMLFVSTSSGIVAMRVAKSGALTEVAGSPFGSANDYVGLAVAEIKKHTFLYAAGHTSNSIVGFEVAKTGALVELPSPAACGTGPRQVKVAGNVLATLCTDDIAWVFKINGNGTLSHDANGVTVDESIGFANTDIAINPNKKTIYVVSDNGGVYPYHVSKASGAYSLTGLPFNAMMFSHYGSIAMIGPKSCLIARDFPDDADADMFAARIDSTGAVSDSLSLAQASLVNTIDAFACSGKQRVAVASSDSSDVSYLFGLDPKDGSLGFLDDYGYWFFDAPENFTGAIVIQR